MARIRIKLNVVYEIVGRSTWPALLDNDRLLSVIDRAVLSAALDGQLSAEVNREPGARLSMAVAGASKSRKRGKK